MPCPQPLTSRHPRFQPVGAGAATGAGTPHLGRVAVRGPRRGDAALCAGRAVAQRFGGGRWHGQQPPSGNHPFDRVCLAHGIPQTHPGVPSADQRHGRALQPPHRRGPRQRPANSRQRCARTVSAPTATATPTSSASSRPTTEHASDASYKAPIEALRNHTEDNAQAGTQCSMLATRAISPTLS